MTLKPIIDAERVLVIKHGALGDFVLALPAMAAIRARFPRARITLQTTPGLESFASASPYFDEVDPLGREKGAKAMLALAGRVRAGKYGVVFDLQNSERTAMLHFLLGPLFRPKWNGIAGGASHRVRDPRRLNKHVVERLAEQIALTGIARESALRLPDLTWAAAAGKPPEAFGVAAPFLLMAARASARRAVKEWPVERFVAIAKRAAAQGLATVLVGAGDEREALQTIARAEPSAHNLAGQTTLCDLAALGARASGALGNDTGPIFIAAAAGAPSVALYSRHSLSPEVCAPRGPRGVIPLSGRELTDIDVAAAAQALRNLGVLST